MTSEELAWAIRRHGVEMTRRSGYSAVAGDQKFLCRQYGLDGETIAETVLKNL